MRLGSWTASFWAVVLVARIKPPVAVGLDSISSSRFTSHQILTRSLLARVVLDQARPLTAVTDRSHDSGSCGRLAVAGLPTVALDATVALAVVAAT